MTKRERIILKEFPNALDEAVNKKFGKETECKSTYAFLGDMKYHTVFKDNGKNKDEIEAFIEGFLLGNLELRERLTE